jgi:hypothetical protein
MSEEEEVLKKARELANSPTFPGWGAIGQQFGREIEIKGKVWEFCPFCISNRRILESPPGMKLLDCGHILREK